MCILGIGVVALVIVVLGLVHYVCSNWGDWHDDDFGYAKGNKEGVHCD